MNNDDSERVYMIFLMGDGMVILTSQINIIEKK